MDEWLTTKGLIPAEENFIKELRRWGEIDPSQFLQAAEMFWVALPDIVRSAIAKARQQGKCRCWPD